MKRSCWLIGFLAMVAFCLPLQAQSVVDRWNDLSPNRFAADLGGLPTDYGNSLVSWQNGLPSQTDRPGAETIRFNKQDGTHGYPFAGSFAGQTIPPGVYTGGQGGSGSFDISTGNPMTGVTWIELKIDIEGWGQFSTPDAYPMLSLNGDAIVLAPTQASWVPAPDVIAGAGRNIWSFQWDFGNLQLPVDSFSLEWVATAHLFTYSVEVTQAVPEPGTVALLIASGAGWLAWRRRFPFSGKRSTR